MMKAPKGGIVSAVNGQFYEGGEFLPDHGKFCGRGRNRIAQATFEDIAARLLDAKGWTLRYVDKFDAFQAFNGDGLVMWTAKSARTFEAFCN